MYCHVKNAKGTNLHTKRPLDYFNHYQFLIRNRTSSQWTSLRNYHQPRKDTMLSSLLLTSYPRPSRLFRPRLLSLPQKLPTSSSITFSDISVFPPPSFQIV